MKPEQQPKKNYQSKKWHFCCNLELSTTLKILDIFTYILKYKKAKNWPHKNFKHISSQFYTYIIGFLSKDNDCT